jgi:transcriptional regulator with XRE-family HTH domain
MPDTTNLQTTLTLAQRMQIAREKLGITPGKLAELTRLDTEYIIDLEAGIEVFLSPATRQKLARVLKVEPKWIQAGEKPPQDKPDALNDAEKKQLLRELREHPHQTHYCPQCGAHLFVRIFERRDIEDNLLLEVKTHCTQCLFRLYQ